MTQADLNRAVAKATGESVDSINRMGFSLMTVPTPRERAWARVRRFRQYAQTHGRCLSPRPPLPALARA